MNISLTPELEQFVQSTVGNGRYSSVQLSTLGLNIARSQPSVALDMLDLMNRAIARTQTRIPTWERSLEEVKLEWNLP